MIPVTSDGELHYVFEEPQTPTFSKTVLNLDEDEIKKMSRRQASKPLYILVKNKILNKTTIARMRPIRPSPVIAILFIFSPVSPSVVP